jgi:ABC-2 type transport system ATP-binding protein
VIEFRQLKKSYGSLVAVDTLSLTIDDGCVFGFIGRNGAGKTTTIRMMMGLLEPSAGTVLIGGHDVRREPEKAKAITGYLPDHPFLYDKLTAYEFLRFVGGLYAVPERERDARIAELLADFALAERGGELVETYSHGMKQRLALAAALLHQPRVLVLDEPMVGLDPQGALDFRRLLARLAREGRTIFLSTHSLAVAEELCDRIGVLDRGRLVALGDLAELRSRAASMPSAQEVRDRNGSATLEAVFLQLISATEGQW